MKNRIALITGYAKNPDFVKSLLASLKEQTYREFDCYVYATPNCLAFLDDEFGSSLNFKCNHLKLDQNRGFAGNNNDTIIYASKQEAYESYVLVNDDTLPDKKWLAALVKASEGSDKIGAVASKMVFYRPFVTLTGITQASNKTEARHLGLRFYSNTRFRETYYPKRFYKDGFYHVEEDEINPFRWTSEKFTLEMPVQETPDGDYVLDLFLRYNPAVKSQDLELFIDDQLVAHLEIMKGRIHYEVIVDRQLINAHKHNIIQNAGTELYPDRSIEVGFGEVDKGQYNVPRDISLFCGGACLLKTEALRQTGLFMDGLFSYYEDSDLSVRLKRKGFTISYAPESLIYHYHTGTSKEWSPLFTYYAFRNKIIFSARTFGLRSFFTAFGERFKETWWYFKQFAKSRFRNRDYRARLKLNSLILRDSIKGVIRFKPQSLVK